MTEQNNDKGLKPLYPRNAPAWSIGVVAVITAAVGGFSLLWPNLHPLVQENMKMSAAERHDKVEVENTTVSSLLGMIQNNMKNTAELTKVIYEAQRSVNNISEEMVGIKKELNATTSGLRDCEEKIKACKKW